MSAPSPGAGEFCNHPEGEPVWGQNLVHAFYTDDKTSYPLAFRQYNKADDEDEQKTKYDLVREMITELEEEVGVPAGTCLFDAWVAHDSGLIEHAKDWIGPLRGNRQVTYANKQRRVDALKECIDKEGTKADGGTYKIWTKTVPVSKLGEVRLVITKKVTDESEENPVKYLPTNKIDSPSAHIILELFVQMARRDIIRGLERGFG